MSSIYLPLTSLLGNLYAVLSFFNSGWRSPSFSSLILCYSVITGISCQHLKCPKIQTPMLILVVYLMSMKLKKIITIKVTLLTHCLYVFFDTVMESPSLNAILIHIPFSTVKKLLWCVYNWPQCVNWSLEVI